MNKKELENITVVLDKKYSVYESLPKGIFKKSNLTLNDCHRILEELTIKGLKKYIKALTTVKSILGLDARSEYVLGLMQTVLEMKQKGIIP